MPQRIKIFIKKGKKLLARTINRASLKNFKAVGYHNNRRVWKALRQDRTRRFNKVTGKTVQNRRYVVYRFAMRGQLVNEYNLDEFVEKARKKYDLVKNRDKKFIAQRIVLVLSYDKDYRKRKAKSKVYGREFMKVYGETDEIGTTYFEREKISTLEMFREFRETLYRILMGEENYNLSFNDGLFYAVDLYVQFIEDKIGDSDVEIN